MGTKTNTKLHMIDARGLSNAMMLISYNKMNLCLILSLIPRYKWASPHYLPDHYLDEGIL